MKSVFKLGQVLFLLMIFVIFLEDASADVTCTVKADCGVCSNLECRNGLCYKKFECEDGVDNDRDGFIDGEDPGCQGAIGDVNHGKVLVANNTSNRNPACVSYTMIEDADVVIDLGDDDVVVIVKRSEITGSDNPYVILASSHGSMDTLDNPCNISQTPINVPLVDGVTGKTYGSYGDTDSAFFNRDGTLRVYYNAWCNASSPSDCKTVSTYASMAKTRSSRIYHLLAGDIIYLGTDSDKDANARCPNSVMLYNKQFVESTSHGGADDPICTY